jgi:hypothetical protein
MKIEGKIEAAAAAAAARATDGERGRECVCVSLLAAKKTRKKELGELVCRQALERSTAFASGVKGRGREFRDLWPGVQQPLPCV